MRLLILGSGTCVPSIDRGNAGYYLETDGEKILIDPGSGSIRFLARSDIDYKKITTLCVSHLHPDHTTDLISLLFSLIHDEKRDNPINIKVIAPVGFKLFFKNLKDIYKGWIYHPEVSLEIVECSQSRIQLNNIEIQTFLTGHTENSIGFIFQSRGKSLLYTGDTGINENLLHYVQKCRFLLIECSHLSKKSGEHLSPEGIARIVQNSPKLEQVILTHFYEEVDFEKLDSYFISLIEKSEKMHFAIEMEEYII